MTEYVVFTWQPGNVDAVAQRAREALGPGWRPLISVPGFFAAVPVTTPDSDAFVLDNERGVVIGQLFDRAATDAGRVARAAPQRWPAASAASLAQALVSLTWGSYVVVLRGNGAPTVIRDPLGAQECLTWQNAGIRIIASCPFPALSDTFPRDNTVDWVRLADLLAAPAASGEALALTHLAAAPYGAVTRLGAVATVSTPTWHPASFCPPRVPPAAADSERLAMVVDACVAAWASAHPRICGELSGGLDSAIVAAALQRTGGAGAWFNFYCSDPQGDERSFARAVGDALDLTLVEVCRSGRALTAADLQPLSTGARPGVNGMDVHYDRDMGERAAELGSTAIFTGQGGDAVFFQMPTRLIAAEVFDRMRGGPRQPGRLSEIARSTRSTLWTVAATALTRGRWPRVSGAAGALAGSSHRWLADTGDLSPAKRLQLWGLANSRVCFAGSQRSAGGEVVHPLLSQPLVEHVLAIPVLGLTGGGSGDRFLARKAYAGRVPDQVRLRHGKGDLTAFYGRLVARSASMLRDHLDDGVLAAHGLIGKADLERFDPAHLAGHDCYIELLGTALIESWARHWTGRAGGRRG